MEVGLHTTGLGLTIALKYIAKDWWDLSVDLTSDEAEELVKDYRWQVGDWKGERPDYFRKFWLHADGDVSLTLGKVQFNLTDEDASVIVRMVVEGIKAFRLDEHNKKM